MAQKSDLLSGVVDLGNGVYQFRAGNFPEVLSAFIGANPGLRVVSIAGLGGQYGDWGYVVITEPR